uniref:Uncharacterized protein n=1 Tax=Anguilla anguilla TaxID=7936 RepID=A0A0E9WYE1_ANGAN
MREPGQTWEIYMRENLFKSDQFLLNVYNDIFAVTLSSCACNVSANRATVLQQHMGTTINEGPLSCDVSPMVSGSCLNSCH